MAGGIKLIFIFIQLQTYKYTGSESVDRVCRSLSERHLGF